MSNERKSQEPVLTPLLSLSAHGPWAHVSALLLGVQATDIGNNKNHIIHVAFSALHDFTVLIGSCMPKLQSYSTIESNNLWYSMAYIHSGAVHLSELTGK